jgi:PTS system galactitol-specific IIA component
MFFDEEIMTLHANVPDSTTIITQLAHQLETRKIVSSNFLNCVLEREVKYPTGLATGTIGVAIPHTGSTYIYKSQIAFASLKKPVVFKSMVDLSQSLQVSLVFMIAMSKPHEQTALLSNLMGMFQKQVVLEELLKSDTKQQVIQILNTNNII